jgi:hypothetical protein
MGRGNLPAVGIVLRAGGCFRRDVLELLGRCVDMDCWGTVVEMCRAAWVCISELGEDVKDKVLNVGGHLVLG